MSKNHMTDSDLVLNLEIQSKLENVSTIGSAVSRLSQELGFDDMQCYQIETCVIEAVNNAIIHAYKGSSDKFVKIYAYKDINDLIFEVRDNGKTMHKLPPNEPVSVEEESGRGWYIMQQWMDKAVYLSSEGINCVRLKKHLTKKNQPGAEPD